MTTSQPSPNPLGSLFDPDSPPEDPWAELTSRQMAQAMRSGVIVTDHSFDRFLPGALHLVSDQHWTPLAVARLSAQWLDRVGARTVVDIGSGAGKFCVAAALSGGCSYIGIEQRQWLVKAARTLATTFEVESRVEFRQGVFGEGPMPDADAYYLFNPFAECLFGPASHLDEEVELTKERHQRDINAARNLFHDIEVGTYVLTYHGYGGRMPSNFRQVFVDEPQPGGLRLWHKSRSW